MKEMTLNFNVKVDIGVTPTLEALGNRVLAALWPDAPQPAVAEASEAPATEAPTTEAPTTEAPATEAPATEAPAPVASEPKPVYNNDYLIEAHDKVRNKFGAVKGTPQGKALNKLFNEIAQKVAASHQLTGIEKPQQLPEDETRVSYVRELEGIQEDGKGGFAWLPF